MKLKVTIEKNDEGQQEVFITGDAQGLEQLREACANVINKVGPASHHHFEWQLENLAKNSTSMTIHFSKNEADF